jgi:hypothetical protein
LPTRAMPPDQFHVFWGFFLTAGERGVVVSSVRRYGQGPETFLPKGRVMNNNADPTGMLCVLGLVLVAVALVITIWWRIWDKTGYGGAMSLLMLIPIIGFIMILVLAFGDWPIQQEVRRLRRQLGDRDDYEGGRRSGGGPGRDNPLLRPRDEGDQGYTQ